ncbi:CD209 antigen-like protein C, partial [Acanthochromis polyacanthus]|uniref:CD209 antigen-like protein C n=1 Tax=Acanthochromis polyacanthus TaxID=80966 RepID=UPI0022342C9F
CGSIPSDSRDFRQWTADLANHTTERGQLLDRYQNLSYDRDQLLDRYRNLNREKDQLLGQYENLNREKDQLLGRYQNLNSDRDQLLNRYQNLNHEKDQLQTRLTQTLKDVGTCPSEWKQFGGSCYFFSQSWSSWNSSRQHCLSQRAHLVVVSSRQEMVFLNKLGYRVKFWIGLSQTSSSSNWEWTDGRSPEAMYWRYGHPLTYLNRRCAVFNSFAAGSYDRTFYSWSSESCTQFLRWVCKKEAVPSDL